MSDHYIIKYHNGERWVTITSLSRFWEPRRYASKQDAELTISMIKLEAPSWFRFRALRARRAS